ncbi:MAG: VWA domain-containing protein [Candidatus Acidiferrales bacterium]
MKTQRISDGIVGRLPIATVLCCAFLGWLLASSSSAQAQSAPAPAAAESASQPQQNGPVVRSETRLVRVDVIVTDKKGNYIHDLTANDFKVYDDNKQQEVANFSFGADPNSPAAAERRYTVLFFDDSSMDASDQPRARAAAVKFIEANVAPDRALAVVEFTGALRITQNFTTDAAKLKQVASGIQNSSISTNPPSPTEINAAPGLNGPSLNSAENNFGAYSVLLSIRILAKNLAAVAGRKSLVLFTAGFPLTPERDSELTATIDACNKANVAIYPLDVRGLVAMRQSRPRGEASSLEAALRLNGSGGAMAGLRLASFHPSADFDVEPQHGGGGGGGGHGGGGGGGGTGGGAGGSGGGGKGGSGGGGTGGTGGKGGTGGTGGGGGVPRGGLGQPFANPNFTQPRVIVPSFPPSASTNQQVLYALAAGTGGFPIFNTNDLLTGLQKIAAEQNEYYLLGFAPSDSAEGSCHTLKVKVERSGTNVRARSGYCNVRPADALAGKPIEKELEAHASSASSGSAGGSLQAPYFYTASNEARVNLVMEIPPSSVEFNKIKGKYHADVNVLGIAYRPDGSVAARFSDQQTFDLEKDAWKELTKSPIHYQNQFVIAPGQYRLTVVLSGGGQNFGKYEMPLNIDAYDGKAFSLSGIALTKHLERVSDLGGALDADLLADHTPLVVHQMEVIPSGSNRFKKTDKVALYAQMYDPGVANLNPPALRVAYQVVDQKTGKPIFATGTIDASPFIEKGSPVVPLALVIPVDSLSPGMYRIELQGGEAGGAASPVRTVDFVME